MARKEKTKKSWQKVEQTASNAMDYFYLNGFPDYWDEFDRASEDAIWEIRRLSSSW